MTVIGYGLTSSQPPQVADKVSVYPHMDGETYIMSVERKSKGRYDSGFGATFVLTREEVNALVVMLLHATSGPGS